MCPAHELTSICHNTIIVSSSVTRLPLTHQACGGRAWHTQRRWQHGRWSLGAVSTSSTAAGYRPAMLVALVLPLLGTGAFCVSAMHHRCTGHACPICERINTLWALFASFMITMAPVALYTVGLPTLLRRMRRAGCHAAAPSPVLLFVRLNI